MLVIFLRKKEERVEILEFLENPLKGVRKIILSYDYYYKKTFRNQWKVFMTSRF